MEHPVASSGPMLRRAATFSHRTERALKDVNGRVGLVNKSQDRPSPSKPAVDAQKVTRPSKQYSAVASRYAAPLASNKGVADASHSGHANVTKLPFITGRSGPSQQRRPLSDNVSSSQAPLVFAASCRDAKAGTVTKKGEGKGGSVGAKRARVGVRASMVGQKAEGQTRAPRFVSVDKGGCACSKGGAARGSAEAGSSSLLHSAAHWVSLIEAAEGEKKHGVVVDLFRLAMTLKAEPSSAVVAELKRYEESWPSDKAVKELVGQCSGSEQEVCCTSTEVVDKAVCEGGELRSAPSPGPSDVSGDAGVSTMSVVSAVVCESEGVAKKEAAAKKAPHFMGRTLSRSATFSVVDAESRSQHAKAEYGKKLSKTLEFLASQAAEHCAGTGEAVGDGSAKKAESPVLACVAECVISDDQEASGFRIGARILDLASEIGKKVVVAPCSEELRSPVREGGSAVGSIVSNGSAEKPVDSLSEWLDGESSEIGTPEVQSALAVDSIDLSPNTVKQMDVDSLMKQVVSRILPDVIVKLPLDLNVSECNGRPSTLEFQVRRKSWQDAGEQSMTEIVESISRSHRHSLSAEAMFLSAPGSVEEKVKLFTGLAEVKGAAPGSAEHSAPGSASKERHEVEGVEETFPVIEGIKNISQTIMNEFQDKDCPVNYPMKTASAVFTPVEAESSVRTALEMKSALEVPVVTESVAVQGEGSKHFPATPIPNVYTKENLKKGDAVPVPIPATPSAATPREPASVAILRARHRRSSSVGNMTPSGPFDMTSERSPFGGSSSSQSGQSSSAKSKRVSRGYKEVTPRMDLPKPSWKAIVEREMKGSKLKGLLAAELPKESSPLAEYVHSQMENQDRDPESGLGVAKERDANSTCTPARPVSRMTRSSSMKNPAAKEELQEGAAEPSTAQRHKKLNEGEQELDAVTTGCSTPGSAVRRSARIQKKVQSRRNVLFKEDFIYMK